MWWMLMPFLVLPTVVVLRAVRLLRRLWIRLLDRSFL
jgi:hypothetical protein